VNLLVLWAILAIVFLIIEILSPGAFFAFFFMLSAAGMIFFERFIDSLLWEISIFSIISVVLTFAVRPILIKYFDVNKDVEKSNVDAFLTKEGIVIEEIKEKGTGKIKVDYEEWTAKSFNGEFIPKDTRVNLDRIDGNVVFVKVNTEEAKDI
jgi:membrane protein implicated in regulation of membrane protease activity